MSLLCYVIIIITKRNYTDIIVMKNFFDNNDETK